MTPSTIRKIGEEVGRVEEIDEGEGGNCLGQYARVRVTRDINKPLQRCVKLKLDLTMESQTVLIRYERLPEFSSACGRLGHLVRHCEDPKVNKTIKAFGPWLRATRTQDLRRTRRSDVRGDKEGGRNQVNTREATMAARGSSIQEEERYTTTEEDRTEPDPRPDNDSTAPHAQLIIYDPSQGEERGRPLCRSPTDKNEEGKDGGHLKRANCEQETTEEDAIMIQSPTEHSTMIS